MTPGIKVAVVLLLVIALIAMGYNVYLILFRLRDHLVSKSYQAIFISKILWAILCASAIYLIIWPLPKRVVIVSFLWFLTLALACIHSAVGFFLYTRDVNAVLKSDKFIDTLPAKPPTDAELLQITKERKDVGEG